MGQNRFRRSAEGPPVPRLRHGAASSGQTTRGCSAAGDGAVASPLPRTAKIWSRNRRLFRTPPSAAQRYPPPPRPPVKSAGDSPYGVRWPL